MATHQISILNHTVVPDSGKVWFEPYDILGSNDQWKHMIIRIDEDGTNNAALTTRTGIYGCFLVPQNYVGSAVIEINWTATATDAENVVFDFDYRAITGNDTESMDQAGTVESDTVTDAYPSAPHERLTARITGITSGNIAAGDLVEFLLVQDGTDGSDTSTNAVIIFDVIFEYADA
jgi:hypothetical protein